MPVSSGKSKALDVIEQAAPTLALRRCSALVVLGAAQRGTCLIVFTLALFAAWPSSAITFDAGLAAFSAGRFEQAAKIWRPLAEQGEAQAQYALGDLYLHGKGVDRDLLESTRWYRKAAEHGHALAEFNLGNAYRLGRGVNQDHRQAAVWWLRAARQDVAIAQFNLALSFYLGRGVIKDDQVSDQWLRRAADNGHARAREIIEGSAPDAPAGIAATTNSGSDNTASAAHMPAAAALRWLQKQHPEHYTVQLIVSSSANRTNYFMRKHAFNAPVVSFEHMNKSGAARFTVVHGSYRSQARALSAIKRLPNSVQKIEPFARRFASLQRQMGHRPTIAQR